MKGEAGAPILIESVAAMQAWSRRERACGRRIGFVPTMGDLHEGHLSLMRLARERCERLVVSVFVNPTQFGPGEDFDRYPRNLAADMEKLKAVGADACFAPEVTAIYPPGDRLSVDVGWGLDKLCGAWRPGHFEGVANVVARLFNAVLPDEAFFGQKDAQQALILERMTRSLHFPVELRLGPTVREADGLAMSSRNAYLTDAERRRAPGIYLALQKLGRLLAEGERDPAILLRAGKETLAERGLTPEYLAVVDPRTLEPPERVGPGLLLAACAVRLGRARLIDNHVFRIEKDGVRESLLF